jgi:Rad3-related DNA helicase
MLFSSCNKDESIIENEFETSPEGLKFDFSFYENHKGNLLELNIFENKINGNKSKLTSRLELNNTILKEINNQLGTKLDFSTDFKQLNLDSHENIVEWSYKSGTLTKVDIEILNDFNKNLNILQLSDAINILEEDVHTAHLNPMKVEKFQYLANVVKLLEYEGPGIFTSSLQQKNHRKSCLSASAGLAFASAALVAACNPPALGATVGWGCYLAGANFVRASIEVGKACGD